ncbi:RNA polymerase sigma-70 factor, ECF subfamily [Rhizobium aethiopicum]|uniref:RNA polymerase sigma-70 factor, ECF subfamily n=1 Tax=Rhizobium aethiopicum TaxID=1138170 RepID=A0A1C3Y4K2_9HYPH|nr:DUF6596 domain-containing protein [Rhizobium aethiopicum]SCB59422.1 RNA polymerase sigma-70 factor, ECF subfamily [Rhizobium aethiopicum]
MRPDAGRVAEQVARQSYGKLIAFLAARSRDVPAAEDALSEALAAALRVWPKRGIPAKPEAWLLVAARRNLMQAARHRTVETKAQTTISLAFEEAEERMNEAGNSIFPDERLKLLFACTHPAIDSSVHTALMLQTILGIEAKTIARAFVVSAEAMSQRLVRAKVKIREAGIPFTVPPRPALPGRLAAVLSAIYAAYGLGWDGLDGEEAHHSLAGEAIWLGRALLTVLPDEPEALGLLSLMLHCEARRDVRRDGNGCYVPLDEQDPVAWNANMIAEADALLRKAGSFNHFGPYQCQAAIQSVHAARRLSGTIDWPALTTLYAALLRMKPTLGARVAQAAVVGRALSPAQGLDLLDRIDPRTISAYQPYWAVRAFLLARAGDDAAAADAYMTAIGLSDSPAVRAFLAERLKQARQAKSG